MLSFFQILKHIGKVESLLPAPSEKKLSVMCTQMLPVLFHLNTSLVYYSPFFFCIFAQFRIFQTFTWNSKNSENFLKMLATRNLLANASSNFQIRYLSKSQKLTQFQRRYSELPLFLRNISNITKITLTKAVNRNSKFCNLKDLFKTKKTQE